MTEKDWPYAAPPDLSAFHQLAREAFDEIPEGFRALCGNVAIHVAELASRETLDALGMADPMELSGLFEGVGLPDIGVSHPYPYPNHIHLYRRPIIAEWRALRTVTLKELVAHVLVHEIGHHFGLSDEDMHEIEERDA